ncbi:MAG: alpha/beta hydrolase [Rubellimicrobium sp.]|nr:alpha/beta hydrolase [Rubellimicrobium sp.]
MARDWDEAFANSAHVPGSGLLPDQWARAAAAFRASLPAGRHEERRHGPGARQTCDLFLPEGPPRGLFVFVHGGYWLAFGKADWSHLAAGALARGWAVAMPQYTLAPAADLPDMVHEVARAVTDVAGRVAGPLHLAGHSAGGHLVTRLLCDDSPLGDGVLARIGRAVSISGLHDLRPLLATTMRRTLGLDAATAAGESAALHAPHPRTRALTLWVGADERPEFLRQSRLMALMWASFEVDIALIEEEGRNHFTVIDALADPASPLVNAILRP